MSSTHAGGHINSGYIDLSTLPKEAGDVLYAPPSNTKPHPFYDRLPKSPYYTVVPHFLDHAPSRFGGHASLRLMRGGDTIPLRLNVNFQVPRVSLASSAPRLQRLRWTRNWAHHLVKKVSLKVGDRIIWSFDSLALDCLNAFSGRPPAYSQMIGNVPELINPTSLDPNEGRSLPSRDCHLPLDIQPYQPWFYPPVTHYHHLTVDFEFRSWEELLILDDFGTGLSRPAQPGDLAVSPTDLLFDVVAEMVLSTKQQSGQIADWVFQHAETHILPSAERTGTYLNNMMTIYSAELVHTMFIGVRNMTNKAEHSNYTTEAPRLRMAWRYNQWGPAGVEWEPRVPTPCPTEVLRERLNCQILPELANLVVGYYGDVREIPPRVTRDPMIMFGLFYAETQRLNIGATYLAGPHPLGVGLTPPTELGYHVYSYGRQFGELGPATDYGKLTNVAAAFTLQPDLEGRHEAFVVMMCYRPAQFGPAGPILVHQEDHEPHGGT